MPRNPSPDYVTQFRAAHGRPREGVTLSSLRSGLCPTVAAGQAPRSRVLPALDEYPVGPVDAVRLLLQRVVDVTRRFLGFPCAQRPVDGQGVLIGGCLVYGCVGRRA